MYFVYKILRSVNYLPINIIPYNDYYHLRSSILYKMSAKETPFDFTYTICLNSRRVSFNNEGFFINYSKMIPYPKSMKDAEKILNNYKVI